MRKKMAIVSAVTLAAVLGSVNAAVITSVTALDGQGASFTTTTTANLSSLTNAMMQSFVADGVTYNTLSAAASGASYTGGLEGILYHPGGTAPTASVALTDGDLGTGGLDPLGDNIVAGQHFRFDSTTFASSTVFYMFNNGTPAGGVQLVDTAGDAISNTIGAGEYGGEVQLGAWNYSRTNGGDLTGRDVAGVTFSVADFTFDSGKTFADVVGFRVTSSNTTDLTDAGIAVAIPEPATLGLIGIVGVGLFAARRFRV
jgi:hypothetical protein